jgi:hypothetical protein
MFMPGTVGTVVVARSKLCQGVKAAELQQTSSEAAAAACSTQGVLSRGVTRGFVRGKCAQAHT